MTVSKTLIGREQMGERPIKSIDGKVSAPHYFQFAQCGFWGSRAKVNTLDNPPIDPEQQRVSGTIDVVRGDTPSESFEYISKAIGATVKLALG